VYVQERADSTVLGLGCLALCTNTQAQQGSDVRGEAARHSVCGGSCCFRPPHLPHYKQTRLLLVESTSTSALVTAPPLLPQDSTSTNKQQLEARSARWLAPPLPPLPAPRLLRWSCWLSWLQQRPAPPWLMTPPACRAAGCRLVQVGDGRSGGGTGGGQQLTRSPQV